MVKRRTCILFGLLFVCMAGIYCLGNTENVSSLESTTQISSGVNDNMHPISSERPVTTDAPDTPLPVPNTTPQEGRSIHSSTNVEKTVSTTDSKTNQDDFNAPTTSGNEEDNYSNIQKGFTKLSNKMLYDREVQSESVTSDSVTHGVSEVSENDSDDSVSPSFGIGDDLKTVEGESKMGAATSSVPYTDRWEGGRTGRSTEPVHNRSKDTSEKSPTNSITFPSADKGTISLGNNSSYEQTTDKTTYTNILPPEKSKEPTEFVFAGVIISSCNRNQFCFDRCESQQKPASFYSLPTSSINEPWAEKRIHREERDIDGNHRKCSFTVLGERFCSCDKHCVIIGDCCPDVFESCMKINNTDEIVDYIRSMKILDLENKMNDSSEEIKKHPEEEDEIIQGFLKTYGSCNKDINDGILVVDRCPENFTDHEVKEKCEIQTSHLLPPVTATLSTDEIPFKNVFCPMCHGLDKGNLTAWNHQFHCIDNLDIDKYDQGLTLVQLTELVKNNMCNVTFQISTKNFLPRKCHTELINCNQNIEISVEEGNCSEVDGLLCTTYIFPTVGYKNPHCLKCLSTERNETENRDRVCKSSQGDFSWNFGGRSPKRGGILIILDIFGKYTLNEGGKSQHFDMCSETQVYNPLTLDCKTLYCPQGFEPYKGECLALKEDYFVDSASQLFPNGWNEIMIHFKTFLPAYRLCQQLRRHRRQLELNYFTLKKIAFDIFDRKSSDIEGLENSVGLSQIQCLQNIKDTKSDGLDNVGIYFGLKTNVGFNISLELMSTIKNLKYITWRLGDDVDEMNITNLINVSRASCLEGGNLKTFKTFSTEMYKGHLYAVFKPTGFAIFYPLNSIGYTRTYTSIGKEFFNYTDYVSVCEEATLFSKENCSIVAYGHNETLMNGSRLLILESGRYYEKEDFEIHREKIFVCSDLEFQTKESKPKNNLEYRVCSYVLTIISSIFLLITLIIYYEFPELRTLPGKMTANLAGSMLLTFLFNLVTLEDVYNEYVCPFLAAIAHLVTLAHFGWMSAIAVDMALTFGSRSLNPIKNLHDDSFVRYGAVVWGLSAVIVTTSVVLDIIHPDEGTTRSVVSEDEDKDNTTTSSSGKAWNFPRYGYPDCTWFSGPLWTKLAFIFVPYLITFLINTVSFVLTLVGIEKSSVSSQRAGKKSSNRTRCLIYIKLSTAMGFTWLLSVVISSFPENLVLPYISLLLILLQGLLLFLAFMANKRVSSLILNRLKSEKVDLNSTHLSSIATSHSNAA